ncbi:hypothetical protein, conserved [Leishmania tarentolae]|uniref:Uncharacterized protein n=1 Tax=Leishmania tarentolae TaxID=5689 RepID=A0A640KBB8_LEITA|nr:hypothetical protein, conserved [Leishmania tarentolae]
MHSVTPVLPGKVAAAPSEDLGSNGSGEFVDDIKESLDRIEKLLNRGQQLLYSDDAVDAEQAGNNGIIVSLGGKPADVDAVSIPTAQHVDTKGSSYKLPSGKRAGVPLRGTGAAANASCYRQSTPQHPASHFQRNSQKLHRLLSGDSNHHHASRNTSNHSSLRRHPWANQARVSRKYLRSDSKDKDLVSARGRRIVMIQKEGGIVPNFEEGLDPYDTPQNISIEVLKERIRRELEEYRRLGPLLHRHESSQRRQRGTVAHRAPIVQNDLRKSTSSTTAAHGSKTGRHVPPPASGATPQRAASRSGVYASAAATSPGSQAAPKPRQMATSTNGTPERSTPQISRGERRVGNSHAKRESHPPVMAPPVNNTYSDSRSRLQMSAGSRSASGRLSSKQTAGCRYVAPQHVSYVSRRITDSPSATAVAKSSMTPSKLTTEDPVRVKSPLAPFPDSRAHSTSTQPSAKISPAQLKPKVSGQKPTHTPDPQGDVEEISSSDSMKDCDTSKPYIAPLDLSVIKK